ncbi:FAD/NAD(P)-binding domain-containing protein [Lindgomyces ingoldianus]|uniref:FAD/NAD(P)-binding domain-containing protein n=1 Tax=Lindgomyces ingoldianus TaxID=673940 RepID=A0ACB6QSV7_9PLEO|nr:FAD/NAD(P)-binding domain-containing protein [Lindgomyces ingoldianus]KAF2469976.1 FAD/NAD(P)-binding domain-containing protein [Lindgomyces ingoldianus]
MAVPETTTEAGSKPPTGIKVIIVGAGFGGLTAAIECKRQGHDPVIYEAFPELKALGDIISFGPNAGRIFYRWSNGAIARKMRALSIDLTSYGFNIHKWDTGEIVINQRSPIKDETAPVFNGHRGELHEVVFRYAQEVGVPIHLGNRVERYWEDENGAGIVLEDGTKIVGDVVIGSDGVRSKARTLVLGYEDKPKSSGYAVWRAWFPNKDMLADPETKQFCENGDTFNGWIGPDVHFLFSTIKNGSDCCWVLTHRDEHDIAESWSFPGHLKDVYKVLSGWDPMCTRIVSKTPESVLVDWKLVYRDPLPTWVSGYGGLAPGHGRICLLGDAAHPFLPTSAQGATQALEDGVTLAVTLRKAGKDNIRGALRAYQDIRYERVRKVQKTGETTRDMWHKTDWQKVKENPEIIQFPREDWIFGFDTEAHTEEVGDEVIRRVSAEA